MESYLIHLINNELLVGPEKPEYPKRVGLFSEDYNNDRNYQLNLKDWEASLMKPENAWSYHTGEYWIYADVDFIEKPGHIIGKITSPGQQVEIVKTGDKKCRIIRLI